MINTVQRPLSAPCAPLWFENIQLVSKWIAVPGPRLPRGISR
jgi:hypothetical protein